MSGAGGADSNTRAQVAVTAASTPRPAGLRRGSVGPIRQGAVAKRREIHLAGQVEGQLGEAYHLGRGHVAGHPVQAVLAQLGHVRRVRRRQVRHQVLDSAALGDVDDRVVHPGVGAHHGLHLADLDPLPLDLHLPVEPAEVGDRAVGLQPHQVAGAVEAGAGHRAERVGYESGGGLRRPAVVAAGQLRAADTQLAGDPGRARAQPLVQHVRVAAGQRGADRQRPVPGAGQFAADHDHGGLGRPVPVVEALGRRRGPAVYLFRAARLAGREQVGQVG
ncbi:hypothetical protein Pflav_015430 [Phytohabitans flavus]|uniref:Uncharacterized protein n=1 Tax=Phytohabitans flavus TaxID=1076124 RepID=A0A6F8XMV0_9ACTN|nr:hypothetical protein Pflav_015430 [Phytohabitans flavus]